MLKFARDALLTWLALESTLLVQKPESLWSAEAFMKSPPLSSIVIVIIIILRSGRPIIILHRRCTRYPTQLCAIPVFWWVTLKYKFGISLYFVSYPQIQREDEPCGIFCYPNKPKPGYLGWGSWYCSCSSSGKALEFNSLVKTEDTLWIKWKHTCLMVGLVVSTCC